MNTQKITKKLHKNLHKKLHYSVKIFVIEFGGNWFFEERRKLERFKFTGLDGTGDHFSQVLVLINKASSGSKPLLKDSLMVVKDLK